jgi:response regulator RpfG family c-di-GMP phosphodiesterase
MNHKILVVDDEPANTRMLERVFRNHFDVVTAQSGEEGLELLTVHDISLIVSDQRMPGMTGVEFLKRSAELRPHCVRIILTGYTDVSDLVDALNSNVVYKFVTKPWVTDDLLQTVKRGLSHHETIKAQHRLNSENTRLRDRLNAAGDSFLKVCSEMLRLKDEQLKERAERVRDTARMLGNAMDLDTATLESLSFTALLYGMADIYLPVKVATQGTLNLDIEFSRERGLELLAEMPNLQDVVVAIRHLTEHFDGSGAAGLSGIQIPLASRIVATAKTFDTLIFPDSEYDEALSHEDAIERLQAMSGKQLDPEVVSALSGLKNLDHMRSGVPDRLVSVR